MVADAPHLEVERRTSPLPNFRSSRRKSRALAGDAHRGGGEGPLETIDEGDEDPTPSDGGEFEAESSSDDDGADDEFEEMMMEKLVADFQRENGRAPTMESVAAERFAREARFQRIV